MPASRGEWGQSAWTRAAVAVWDKARAYYKYLCQAAASVWICSIQARVPKRPSDRRSTLICTSSASQCRPAPESVT